MGRLIDDSGVVLHQSPSKQAIKVQVEIGVRFPLHTAAPAKAILAWMNAADRERIVAGMSFTKITNNTITSRKAFREELEMTRRDGFAVECGEEVEGITCVAARSSTFNQHRSPLCGLRDLIRGSQRRSSLISEQASESMRCCFPSTWDTSKRRA